MQKFVLKIRGGGLLNITDAYGGRGGEVKKMIKIWLLNLNTVADLTGGAVFNFGKGNHQVAVTLMQYRSIIGTVEIPCSRFIKKYANK